MTTRLVATIKNGRDGLELAPEAFDGPIRPALDDAAADDAAAVRPNVDVDVEHALEQPCPAHPRRLAVRVSRCAVPLRGLRDDRRTQLRMRGEHPVKADQVQPRARYQRGHALHELLRVHDDVGRAFAIRAFQFQHDLALGVAAQTLVGERSRLAAELFAMVAGVKLQMIPFKGGAQALTDLIGGQVQLSYRAPITVTHHVRSGRLRPLGITSEQPRTKVLADVPTMAEAGYPGTQVNTWRRSSRRRGRRGTPSTSCRRKCARCSARPRWPPSSPDRA
jgi:hypothetical protein